MSVQILNKIYLDPNLTGLEHDILSEFNMLMEILLDDSVSYESASSYLLIAPLNYFSVLSLNKKIYVRQLLFQKRISEKNILKKVYD